MDAALGALSALRFTRERRSTALGNASAASGNFDIRIAVIITDEAADEVVPTSIDHHLHRRRHSSLFHSVF